MRLVLGLGLGLGLGKEFAWETSCRWPNAMVMAVNPSTGRVVVPAV